VRSPPDRSGFTIVELLVAVVILTVGLLAFAGTTMFLIRQVTVAHLTTARTMAVQSVVETLRATPYDMVTAGSEEVGDYSVTWEATVDGSTRAVQIISVGPGTAFGRSGGLSAEAADTFNYRILQP
jgi:prepilin-type N-terminal cleavage/methylation domain-containing protein